MICNRCGEDKGVTFGHVSFCKDCYEVRQARQQELREASHIMREQLAARIVHPAGRSKPRNKASDLWIQDSYYWRGDDHGRV